MSVVTARYTFSGSGEDFGPRKGRRLVILHTFENTDPLKNTMRDALAGAIWQDRNDVLGSYNRLIAIDGVLGCVPDDRISGGVNPASSYFKPVAWLYGLLPAAVVNDPNSYALQLCAMGQRAYYDAMGWPQEIIDGFAWSIIEEERATGVEMVVANHADFQPGNRSDAGSALDLVMKRIPELLALPDTAVEIPDMLFRNPLVRERWRTVVGVPFIKPAGSSGVFTASEEVESFAEVELADGTDARAIAYGGTEPIIMPRRGLVAITGTRVVGLIPPPQGFTQTQMDAAVATANIAFNKNLDTWSGQRPRR